VSRTLTLSSRPSTLNPQARGPAAVGAITAADVRAGQAVTKPSALLHLTRYQTWSDQYGQTG